MNRNRQLNQLQNMDNRTARQDARMQFLQRQQQQPAMRQQQPMPQQQPWQPVGQMQPFQAPPMPNGMVNYPGQFQPALDGMGAAPGAPIRDGLERFGDQMPRGTNIDPGMAMDPSQSPFPMPRGGQEFRNGYAFDQNALPGSSGNMGGISNAGYQSQAPNRMRGGIQGNMGGISNAGYQSQAPNALQRSQGISGNVARGGYRLNRVKGLLATKPPQV